MAALCPSGGACCSPTRSRWRPSRPPGSRFTSAWRPWDPTCSRRERARTRSPPSTRVTASWCRCSRATTSPTPPARASSTPRPGHGHARTMPPVGVAAAPALRARGRRHRPRPTRRRPGRGRSPPRHPASTDAACLHPDGSRGDRRRRPCSRPCTARQGRSCAEEAASRHPYPHSLAVAAPRAPAQDDAPVVRRHGPGTGRPRADVARAAALAEPRPVGDVAWCPPPARARLSGHARLPARLGRCRASASWGVPLPLLVRDGPGRRRRRR